MGSERTVGEKRKTSMRKLTIYEPKGKQIRAVGSFGPALSLEGSGPDKNHGLRLLLNEAKDLYEDSSNDLGRVLIVNDLVETLQE